MNVRVEADAKHDGSLARYIAVDCIFSDDIGRVFTKAQFLDDKLPPEYDQVGDRRDFIVHVHGNEAVLNYRATEHDRYNDADIITELRVTESYVKQNGSWLLTAKQWGVVPVNLRKPVAGDTRLYKDYVGDYEWRPAEGRVARHPPRVAGEHSRKFERGNRRTVSDIERLLRLIAGFRRGGLNPGIAGPGASHQILVQL